MSEGYCKSSSPSNPVSDSHEWGADQWDVWGERHLQQHPQIASYVAKLDFYSLDIPKESGEATEEEGSRHSKILNRIADAMLIPNELRHTFTMVHAAIESVHSAGYKEAMR